MRVFVEGAGLIAPGLPGWAESLAVLRGEAAYAEMPMPKLVASQLPPAERRRATTVTRLALEVAAQAIPAGVDAADVATVFASSGGEVQVIDHIFSELATAERQISPTLFHNSVHNAASGYWSIATGSRQASMSLSAFDDTFAVGLMEAALQSSIEGLPVLLVCYDFPPEAPITRHRPLTAPFGVALLLSPAPVTAEAVSLDIDWAIGDGSDPEVVLTDRGLEGLRWGNPAARSLPLLVALAKREALNWQLTLSGERGLHVQLADS